MTEITEFEKKLIQGLKNRHYSASVHIRDRQEELKEFIVPTIDMELIKYNFLVDEIQKIFDEASK